MTDSPTPFSSSVNRKISIAAGIALLIVGSPMLLLGGVAVFHIFSKGVDSFPLGFVAVLLIVGVFCVSTAIRMILGRKREDGGLLSPFALRTAGVLFATVPAFLILTEGVTLRSLWTILEIGFFFAVAGSCFALASRRQHPVLGEDNSKVDK
ncbi:MAG: hypothetical protein AAFY56_17530 [Pseudomonadota bacterium]